MGDIISMKIGDTLCGRFDIDEGPISGYATITCIQSNQQ